MFKKYIALITVLLNFSLQSMDIATILNTQAMKELQELERALDQLEKQAKEAQKIALQQQIQQIDRFTKTQMSQTQQKTHDVNKVEQEEVEEEVEEEFEVAIKGSVSSSQKALLQKYSIKSSIFESFKGKSFQKSFFKQACNLLNKITKFSQKHPNKPGVEQFTHLLVHASKNILVLVKSNQLELAQVTVDISFALQALASEFMHYQSSSGLELFFTQQISSLRNLMNPRQLPYNILREFHQVCDLLNAFYSGLVAAKSIKLSTIQAFNQLTFKEKSIYFKSLFNENLFSTSFEISNRTKKLIRQAFSSMQTYLDSIEKRSSTSAASQSGYSLSSFFAAAKKIIKSPSDFLRQVEDYKDGIRPGENKRRALVVGPMSSSSSSSSKFSMQRRKQLDQILLNTQMSMHSGINSSSSSRRVVSRITRKPATKSGKDRILDAMPVAIIKGRNGSWNVIRTIDGLYIRNGLNKQQATAVAATLSNRGILVRVPADIKEIPLKTFKINPAIQKANNALIENEKFLKEVVDDIAKNYTEPHSASDYDFLSKTSPADQSWNDYIAANPEAAAAYNNITDAIPAFSKAHAELNKYSEQLQQKLTLDEIRESIAYLKGMKSFWNPEVTLDIEAALSGKLGHKDILNQELVKNLGKDINGCLQQYNKLLKSHYAAVWKYKQQFGKCTTIQELMDKYQELQSKNPSQIYNQSKNALRSAQAEVDATSTAAYDLVQGLKYVGHYLNPFNYFISTASTENLDQHIKSQNELQEAQKNHKEKVKDLKNHEAQLEAVKQLLNKRNKEPIAVPDIGLDYSITTPRSGPITPELKQYWIEQIAEIKSKPEMDRTEIEQNVLEAFAYAQKLDLYHKERLSTPSKYLDQMIQENVDAIEIWIKDQLQAKGFSEQEIEKQLRSKNESIRKYPHLLVLEFLAGGLKAIEEDPKALAKAPFVWAKDTLKIGYDTLEFLGHIDLLIETGQIEKAEQLWDEKRIKLKALSQMARHSLQDYLNQPLHKQMRTAGYHIGYNAAVIKLSQLYMRIGNAALKKGKASWKKLNPDIHKVKCEHLAQEITQAVKNNGLKNIGTAEEVAIKLSKLDQSIGSIETLEKAVAGFKDVPGFYDKNGAFMKVVNNAGSKKGILTAKGAIYEVEKALELAAQGHKITGFEVSYKPKPGMGGKRATFDIQTGKKVIECKDISYWGTDTLNNLRTQFGQQSKIASAYGLKYEIHFKSKILPELKQWLVEQNIRFIEV